MIKLTSLLKKPGTVSKGNFLDLSSREKKRIVKRAAEEAAKMQADLLKRYDKLHSA